VFVTFEGIEGSGKSTQIKLLAETLTARGRSVVLTREPGGSELGRTLRAILLSVETRDLTSRAELFLYLADRAQHAASVIRPALIAGKAVLCDRYADSTVAYQGYGRGLDLAGLDALNAMAVDNLWPGRTILLDLDPETGLTRARNRNRRKGATAAEGRFEAEDLAFHGRVRQGYLALAARHPERFVVIDATAPRDVVTRGILDAVSPLLDR
jgi:dTMP kinase